jgi:Cutinase
MTLSNSITARGTTEPRYPSYGIIVGDPIFNATKNLIPDLTGYSINYPASFACDSLGLGVTDTLSHLKNQSIACPSQKFVLVGYSQGADVMHFSSLKIPTNLYDKIIALVMFGDPGNKGPGAVSPSGGITPQFPKALQAKTKENCVDGDPVSFTNVAFPVISPHRRNLTDLSILRSVRTEAPTSPSILLIIFPRIPTCHPAQLISGNNS